MRKSDASSVKKPRSPSPDQWAHEVKRLVRPRLAAFLRSLITLLAWCYVSLGVIGASYAQSTPRVTPLPFTSRSSTPPPTIGESAGASQARPPGTEGGDQAQPAPPPVDPQQDGADPELKPFGTNLFIGNFLRTRDDGLNSGYVIMPGDQVQVNTWGAIQMSQVLVVDGQGNVFLPEIGPIRLQGVTNADLTNVVRGAISRVYARFFDVYTNLLTAKPVAVFVTGGVKRPGRYAGIPSDSVLFFLDQAGGIDSRLGSYRSVDILRDGSIAASVDLYAFILDGTLPAHQFKDGDTVLVRRRGPVVELQGNVATPALIEFKDQDARGDDALRVIPNAARATEVTITGLRAGAPFAETLRLDEFQHFPLMAGDTILLRDDGRPDTILINLEGEFLGPSILSVRRGSRLIDVLNYVRVNPKLADVRSVHLKRPSVALAQKDAIEDSLFRLERSSLLALSSSQGEADIRVKEAQLTQQFVERARLVQPLGRVVTTSQGAQLNVLLEEGDTVVIPQYTNVVRVGGEVFISHALPYQEGLRAEVYIQRAGGYTDRADEGRVIMLHANAEVEIGDPDAPVRAGDQVLVPPRVDTKEVQNVLDVTQIIYQIAVAAAVVLAL